MDVVSSVTGATGLGQVDLAADRLVMAVLAVQLGMGAVEFVIGLGVVIEFPHPPPVGGMAGAAIAAQGALMIIVLFVAGIAVHGIDLVAGTEMTFLAGHRRM